MSPSNAIIDSTTLIKGFNLQNGDNVNYGGGIFINNSNPKLILLYIKNNNADEKGGGIYCDNSSPTLTDLTISENSAGRGGGIYCYSSNPTLTDLTISQNSGAFSFISLGDAPNSALGFSSIASPTSGGVFGSVI